MRMRLPWVIVGTAVLLLFNLSASAQQNSVPDEPSLTVRITPEKPYLQEEILQVIRLIAPHPFEELELELSPIEGAETITLQQPKNRKFETYGGEGYLYETSRAIFPTRSGPLDVPAVRIIGSIGVGRDETEAFDLRSEGRVFDIRPPPQSFSEDWWLVARSVEIEETWSKPLDELRVGDDVTRRITATVAGVTGAHLPELEQGRSSGITVLPGRTERETEVTPAGVVGHISRSFDIRIDVDRPINISPVRVVWWNTGTEIERRTAARAVRIEPLPRDVDKLVAGLMEEAAAERTGGRYGIAAIGLAALVAAMAFAFWLLRSAKRIRPEDRALFRSLSQDDRPETALRALFEWGGAVFPDRRPASLESIAEALGPEAKERIDTLQRSLFGHDPEPVDTARLAQEIVTLAQRNRRRPLADLLLVWAERLLGPKRSLPSIGGELAEGVRRGSGR